MRVDIEQLFMAFAIFAEDAIVPANIIDVVAPLMRTAAAGWAAAKLKLHMRKCLQQLIKANILRGSAEAGVAVHDVCMSGANHMLAHSVCTRSFHPH